MQPSAHEMSVPEGRKRRVACPIIWSARNMGRKPIYRSPALTLQCLFQTRELMRALASDWPPAVDRVAPPTSDECW
jgi:hypothetical protein